MTPAAPKPSSTDPLAGSHHCMGTAHAIVDLTFRFLKASCASHGGVLSEADLVAAQTDLIESFATTLDYFEIIHQRCMCASLVAEPPLFAQGRMLSTLLFLVAKRSATYCFNPQAAHAGADWVKLYFDGLAKSLLRQIE